MPRFLIVCDVDSTLIDQEVIDLIAAEAGVSQRVSEITEQAMRGELDFKESLTERVALLEGTDSRLVEAVQAKISITKGAAELVNAVHKSDGLIAAVSGGFHEVLDPIAKGLGLDFWFANRFQVADGKLTGKVDGEIIDSASKQGFLLKLAADNGIAVQNTIAVGDGANDIPMLQTAGIGVGFCAKQIVKKSVAVSLEVRDLSLVGSLFGFAV